MINPFTINLPTLDLHQETIDISIYLINNFINENILLKENKLLIIHGIGKKTLQKAVRDYLNENKLVSKIELDPHNDGVTIVHLK